MHEEEGHLCSRDDTPIPITWKRYVVEVIIMSHTQEKEYLRIQIRDACVWGQSKER